MEIKNVKLGTQLFFTFRNKTETTHITKVGRKYIYTARGTKLKSNGTNFIDNHGRVYVTYDEWAYRQDTHSAKNKVLAIQEQLSLHCHSPECLPTLLQKLDEISEILSGENNNAG